MLTTIEQRINEDNTQRVSLAWLAQGRDTAHEWQAPWAGIGQRIDAERMSLKEAMAYSYMPERLSLRTVFAPSNVAMNTPRDERKNLPIAQALTRIPGMRAVTRDDTGEVMGIVNRSYPLEQYAETFGQMFGCTMKDGAITAEPDGINVSCAGVLGRGEQAFVVLRLHDASRLADDAFIQRYLVAHTGCDGHTPRSFNVSVTSPVCCNTLAKALRGRRSRKHGGSLLTFAQAARDAIEQARQDDAIYAAMAQRQLTDREAAAALALTFGREQESGTYDASDRAIADHIEPVTALYHGDGSDAGHATGVRPGRMTGWDLLQATTYHLDHVPAGVSTSRGTPDTGEVPDGVTFDWLRRENTDSLNGYRSRITETLASLVAGTDIVALAMGGAQ